MLGSETAETNLRTMLFPCYLQLLGVDVGERDCGDESADASVTMLFAAVGWYHDVTMLFAAVRGRCWGARLRRRICGRWCYHAICSCWGYRCWGASARRRICGRCCYHAICSMGVDVEERDCGDEAADDAVTMLFAAVRGRCGGARLRRRICGRCCYHAICSCWV